MLNLTLFGLRASFLSVPQFSGHHSLSVSLSHFSRYFQPVFFNSYFHLSRSSFRSGLSSAIFLHGSPLSTSITVNTTDGAVSIEDTTVTLSQCPSDQYGAIWVSASSATVWLNRLGISSCVCGEVPLFVYSKTVALSSFCISNSCGADLTAASIECLERANLSLLTVFGNPESLTTQAPISLLGEIPVIVERCNVTSVFSTTLSSSFWISGAGDFWSIRDFCLWKCDGENAIYASVCENENGTEAALKVDCTALNLIANRMGGALLDWVRDFSIENSFFVENTFGNTEIFHSSDPYAWLVVANSFTTTPFPEVPGVTYSDITEKQDLPYPTTVTFFGLNTQACMAPLSSEFLGFFADLSGDKAIAMIVTAIGVIVVIAEVALYFVKEFAREASLEEDGEPYEDESTGEDSDQ